MFRVMCRRLWVNMQALSSGYQLPFWSHSKVLHQWRQPHWSWGLQGLASSYETSKTASECIYSTYLYMRNGCWEIWMLPIGRLVLLWAGWVHWSKLAWFSYLQLHKCNQRRTLCLFQEPCTLYLKDIHLRLWPLRARRFFLKSYLEC